MKNRFRIEREVLLMLSQNSDDKLFAADDCAQFGECLGSFCFGTRMYDRAQQVTKLTSHSNTPIFASEYMPTPTAEITKAGPAQFDAASIQSASLFVISPCSTDALTHFAPAGKPQNAPTAMGGSRAGLSFAFFMTGANPEHTVAKAPDLERMSDISITGKMDGMIVCAVNTIPRYIALLPFPEQDIYPNMHPKHKTKISDSFFVM